MKPRKLATIQCPGCQRDIKFTPEMQVRVMNADIPSVDRVIDDVRRHLNATLDGLVPKLEEDYVRDMLPDSDF
jgi:hypothetical protein